MRLETILLTPDLAEMFLKNNSANRKLRVTHVDMFVRELQAGTFRTTHQGVAISKSGKLLDGQHRLSAIVKAGIPATMVVAWDCDVETAIDWPVDFGPAPTPKSFSEAHPRPLLRMRHPERLSPHTRRQILSLPRLLA
jgi:hypothetical protein